MKVDTKQPTISVVIPVYNGEEYLEECLKSIELQTVHPNKVIVVDDGSTDRTSERLVIYEQLAHSFDVCIIRQKNSGQGIARNNGLKKVTTDYVLFLDADDTIDTRLFENFLVAVQTQPTDIYHFNWRRMVSTSDGLRFSQIDTDSISEESELLGSECDKLLQITNYFSANNIFRCSFLNENNIIYGSGTVYEDNVFMVAAITRAKRICSTNQSLYNYRQHDKQSTSSVKQINEGYHYKQYIDAVRSMNEVVNARLPYTRYYLLGYILDKFIVYYERRIPKELHHKFTFEFINEIMEDNVKVDRSNSIHFLNVCLYLSIFSKKRYILFRFLVALKIQYARLQHSLRRFHSM